MLTTSQTEIVLSTLDEHDPEIAVKIVKGLIRGFMRDNEAASEAGESDLEQDEKPNLKGSTNPAWYRSDINGQTKLSPEGEEYLYSLFDGGMSIYSAAKKMAISYQACKHRFGTWEKQVSAGNRPNAKPRS